jgi:hypothetical protein
VIPITEWEVVEKMFNAGYTPTVNFGAIIHPLSWHTCFSIGGVFNDGYGDTAPLAICRAALKAVSK